jgi:EPS-associated MarR family transcriptional regulator
MLKYELEYRALKLLEERPDMTQRQLSQALGVSLGKAHYVVKALIDVGWIKLGNFRRSNQKLGYAYLLTPSGIAEKSAITAKFLARKQVEYDALRDEIAQLKREVRQQNAVSEPPI